VCLKKGAVGRHGCRFIGSLLSKKLHFSTLPEGLVIITLSDCLVLYNSIVLVEALEELRINDS
jgi:uncharacterized protein with von Willebrand factor type A (vWA) domain